MAQLILRDKDGIEVGRRYMTPDERIAFYECCSECKLMSHEGKRYTVNTVAWKVPECNCILSVTFHSWEPNDC